jgi:hypothetical protein
MIARLEKSNLVKNTTLLGEHHRDAETNHKALKNKQVAA